MYKPLPQQFKWLAQMKGPPQLVFAQALYGLHEGIGAIDNPIIVGWAKATGYGNVYKHDSDPWCGLFMTWVMHGSGFKPPPASLSARSWLNFGQKVAKPMLGDVIILWRDSPTGWKGHVGMYVGERPGVYYLLGGNESDQVNIVAESKERVLGFRRPNYTSDQSANLRSVLIEYTGQKSTDA